MFVKINGISIPSPTAGAGVQTISSMFDGGRNMDGIVIGTQIGRDVTKIELQWKSLMINDWANVLRIFKKGMFCEVTYFDTVENKVITREMYVGDRSGAPNPAFIKDDGMSWERAFDCKLNLIDRGKGV